MKLPAYALLQMSDQDNERMARDTNNKIRWTMVHEGDGSSGKLKLVRADHPAILYRGQTKQYDPCLPTIARGFPSGAYGILDLPDTDKARLVHGLALNAWFQAEIEKHPMIAWTKAQNVAFDVAAIAQHYGIPKGYMDVSESFQVSAFFATCWFDSVANEWKPMTKGEGVMYRLDVRAIRDRSQPICYQPFPRPTLQWGWTTELLLGEDFLYAPSLQSFAFEHDKTVGEEMLHRFDGGAKLIAPDPTAEVALQMCLSKEISVCFIDEVEADLLGDKAGISASEFKLIRESISELLGIDVVQRANVGFSADQLKQAEADWEACKSDFWQGVGFQIVRTRSSGES